MSYFRTVAARVTRPIFSASIFGAVIVLISVAVFAQSPNTGALTVTVVDQNDAVVPGATITVTNTATQASRDAMSSQGSTTFAALSLTGEYKVSVSKTGFSSNEVSGLVLRASETATVTVKLAVSGGTAEVEVIGTTEGVRDNPQLGLPLKSSVIDETPILGRKVSTLPLLNAAFRQGKGTGDLFVNSTYFITGVGSRRATTFTLDGANNDEAWGRQVAITTLPLGSVQEMTVFSSAFSSEFGWTSGPAVNIVTKSGTNDFHGEGIFMYRPGSWQADSFSTIGFCPGSVPTCVKPATLQSISPVDIPDKLQQYSGTIGGPIIKDRTFFFLSADYTRQDRTTFLSPSLPAFTLPPDGNLEWIGHYRQTLFNGRVDHRLTNNQNLMFRFNLDRFYDDNPQDAVGGTNAPSVARRYSRKTWSTQLNHTWVIDSNLLNEARFSFMNGDPVTKWEAGTLSTIYTRGAGNNAVPFTVGQSRLSDLYGRQIQFSDTLSWTKGRHYLRMGGSIVHHSSGGTGNEPGALTLGTFTFKTNDPVRNQLPLGQLTLDDVLNYQQPINFGIDRYHLTQWLISGFIQDRWQVHRDVSLELGLRYDRQTLTDANANFEPRIGFSWHPGGDPRTSIRGGYGMYYTQIRSNAVAGYLTGGLDGITSYTATMGQTGFPTCLTCVPVNVDPHTIPPSQLPARDITIIAGKRSFYQAQFHQYGLNFDLLQNYPDELVNPRSQVATIGFEREFFKHFFFAADYVRQHVTNLDRTFDLNAPSAFDRTAPGQTRTVAAANATRPILPVNGGVRQVNVIGNLGVADYNGLQTMFSYRGHSKFFFSGSYTFSKATNTAEPDGNGIGPNQSVLSRLGEEERGPSVVDQRHRAVFSLSYLFPWNFTAGTLAMFATARPFNSTTGVDNNGDGILNDRPVVNGAVIAKSAFRGTATSDVSFFVENRIHTSERTSLLLRLEGFNIFNHGNYLARGVTVYGNNETPLPSFGQFVGGVGTSPIALPAFANIDPPRMFQLQARFIF